MQPNSPELDWAGKRCGHNYLPAECPHGRCGYREALVEVERLRRNLEIAVGVLRLIQGGAPATQPKIDESRLYTSGCLQAKWVSAEYAKVALAVIEPEQPQEAKNATE